jgi:hypothetical protein
VSGPQEQQKNGLAANESNIMARTGLMEDQSNHDLKTVNQPLALLPGDTLHAPKEGANT